jgi:hypothetical protein
VLTALLENILPKQRSNHLLRVKTVQEINTVRRVVVFVNSVQLDLLLCPVHPSAKTFEKILDAPQANIQKRPANQPYLLTVQIVLRGNFLSSKVEQCILAAVNVQVEDIRWK